MRVLFLLQLRGEGVMAVGKNHLKRKKRKSLERTDYKYGYLLISPMLIGFTVFVLVPIITTITLSFFDYNLLRGMRFSGVRNYVQLFTNDPTFIKSASNTLYFTILLVPLNMVLCLGLAILLHRSMRGIGFIRTLIFTPYVTSIVSWALVWKFMLQTDSGIINIFLRLLNISGPNWLYTESLAIPVVVIVTLLKGFGMNTIIFIAALKDVPDMYYEAASLDGASGWQQFRKITLPMITPTIFLIIIITMIGSLKVFAQINVLTQGGPGTSTYVFVYYIYQSAFKLMKYGYASAISVVLFILIMALTLLQWLTRKKWVYHEA